MSTMVAMLILVVALGMLVAYYLGYSIGRAEGFGAGFAAGKKEGAVKAYAVGYDRGRHDRQTKANEVEAPPPTVWQVMRSRWLLVAIVSIGAVLLAALMSTKDLPLPRREFPHASPPGKLSLE